MTRIVVIGRPNVGKSTLFNRLFGKRRALVHDEPGVTRDRLEEKALFWVKGKRFPVSLVDTGGLGGERFADEIKAQVEMALAEADVVLMVFDGQAGLTPKDEELLIELHRSGIQKRARIIGVINKVDAESHETLIADFYQTGLDPILTLSAEHNRGIDDLKEAIADAVGFDYASAPGAETEEPDEQGEEPVSEEEEHGEAESEEAEASEGSDEDYEIDESSYDLPDELEDEKESLIKVAIVGRPNVGKSTFVNALLGEKRMITSPIAGTTVDAIDSIAEINGKPFVLIDTAGMRRKSKTEQGIEVLSVVQTKKALERCDVAILLLDGEEGITDQDEKIGGMIEEVGCSVILALNKWDLQKSNPKFTKQLASERIRGKMAFLRYAPLMFVSAKEGTGFRDLAELIEDIMDQRRVKISTKEFTEWVRKESTVHNPANAKFFLCHQSGRYPPTFVCHVNDAEKIHFSLRRYLLNQMRERWGFMGSPIRLLFLTAKTRRSLPRKKKVARKGVKAS